jgi:[ribosomal protein S18]-alanine N-acetyltransferase
VIEAARPDQAERLGELHARAFPEKPWSGAEIAKLMENAAVFAIVSRSESEWHGFAMGWAAAGDSELLTVAVVPEARRRGVGAALVTSIGVTALVRGAAAMHLEVAEDNAAARALYLKLGYEEAGRRHAYYAGEGGSIDAIVMRRKLPRPVV